MFEKKIFAERLRECRSREGERQVDLGKFLGVSSNQIVEMENCRKTTTFERLYKICKHYNISADYLIGLIDDPRPLDGNRKEGNS